MYTSATQYQHWVVLFVQNSIVWYVFNASENCYATSWFGKIDIDYELLSRWI